MAYIYLKTRSHYENLYDDNTVEQCRSGERIVNQTFMKMDKKLPASEKTKQQAGWYLMYSKLYFNYVETVAAERKHFREERIAAWMESDEKKDHKLADAKIKAPYCKACGKDTKQSSKDYMHRETSNAEDRDDILFMFECIPCNKRIAIWQDGTEWEYKEPRCKKCGATMKASRSVQSKVITTTNTCTKCGHTDTYVFDLNNKDEQEEQTDPYHELDRKRFCFDDEMEQKYMQKFNHLLRMAKLEHSTNEHTEHVDIYKAIKEVKQLKIAQLADLLQAALEKGGYRDFKLSAPELGQQVAVGFGCLDDKPDRKDYDSKKQLQKIINSILEETNWRLMSEGIDYRLGFLNGRLKAYEKEDGMKKLIEQRIKSGTFKLSEKEPAASTKKDEVPPRYEGTRMREAVLVYFDQLMLGSIPAEITLKSGRVKPTSVPVIYGNMNPLLRVIIPMRDNDDSVPDFIRNYDFKMGPKNGEKPKLTKDSLGREIKLV